MTSPGAADLLRSVGLLADGPATWGRPAGSRGPGVYVVELPSPPTTAPIELTRVGKWLERVPGLRLDGARPTSKALATRLASFWLPDQPVLYVGSTAGSITARLDGLARHVVGERRPHAGGQWLKVLAVEDRLRVWWAETDAPEEYEDALLSAFAQAVPESARMAIPGGIVLPFANLATPSGERRPHGITGAVLPEPARPPEPTRHVVDVPDGDADGARPEPRATGTTRRTNVRPPAKRPQVERSTRPRAAPTRPTSAPVQLTADGLARLQAEHGELTRVRRPAVVARIRAAKELGDLRENADYTAAREEQSFLEGRIQAIEATLRSAVVVEGEGGPTVVIGSRVVVEHDGEQISYTIVSPTEASPGDGRISYASPVGRALMGHGAGAEVAIGTPSGEVHYRIVEVG